MRYLAVVLSAAASALAVTVATPQGAIQCLPYVLTFGDGVAPYNIFIQPGGDVNAAAIEQYPNQPGPSYSWLVNQPANTQLFIRVLDAQGNKVESGVFTVGANTATNAAACLTAGASTPAAGTTPAGTTPAGTTPAGSTPAGTTPAPTAAGTSPAASGSGSSSASRTSSTTSTGAAAPIQILGGVVGLIGAVAVALA